MKAYVSPLSYLSVSKSPSLVSKKKIYTYNIFKNSNKNKCLKYYLKTLRIK